MLEHDGKQKAVFTGDALFIGDCGRPDLRPGEGNAKDEALKLAKQMYHSLRDKLMPLNALMVRKNNPKKIKGLEDLKNDKIRISMPDKKIEGIGNTVEDAYRKAGGEKLHHKIMVDKVKDSTTFITQIHHRQSPMRILYNKSDVAPVWETEIFYQKSLGHSVDKVVIPEKYNKLSVSSAGLLKDGPNKEAANHFMDFLISEDAQAIFKKYGFKDVPASK